VLRVTDKYQKDISSAKLPSSELGCGVSGGIEAAAQALALATKAHPDYTFIALDFSNAYGTLKQQTILDVGKTLQSAANLINLRHGKAFVVQYTDRKSGKVLEINQSDGCTQGGCLEPEVFTIAQADAVRESMRRVPEALQLGIMDDRVIYGPGTTAFESARVFATEAKKLGLELNESKCKVYRPAGLDENVQYETAMEGYEAAGGLVFGGVPVGTSAFVQAHLQQVITSTKQQLKELEDLVNHGALKKRNVVQGVVGLVRMCMPAKMTHLIRTLPPAVTIAPLVELDKAICETYLRIIGSPPPPGFFTTVFGAEVKDQLHTPIRKGGMGVWSMSETAKRAYVGSLVLVLPIVAKRKLLGNCDPTTDQQLRDRILPDLPGLLQELDPLISKIESLNVLTDESIWTLGVPKAQAMLTDQRFQKADEEFIERMQSPEDQAWVRSICASEAGAFLTATRKLNPMEDAEISTAIKLRLRLATVRVPPGEARRCTREKNKSDHVACVDSTGWHAFRCQGLQRQRTWRHTQGVKVVYRALRGLVPQGYEVIREPFMTADAGFTAKLGEPGTDSARGDILVRKSGSNAAKVVFDLTYKDPVTSDRVPHSSTQTGYTAQLGYQEKVDSYLKRFNMARTQIVPISIELGGRMHKESKKQLTRWINSTIEEGEDGDGKGYVQQLRMAACRRVFEGLSVELQKGLARSVHRLAREVPNYPAMPVPAPAPAVPAAPAAQVEVAAAVAAA
jgi:hypothetical protein